MFGNGIVPYTVSTPEARARIEDAREPYDNVDAILVTHWHEDHFDADAVAAHLSHNARAVLVSSPDIVERVRQRAPDLPDGRFRAVLPAPGGVAQVDVDGVVVRVLRVRHNPTRRLPDQHVAFLVGTSAPLLHVGDADPAADNFTALASLPAADHAVLPFWYVTNPSSRAMVVSAIRPRRIVAVHLPSIDAERVDRALRDAGVDVSLAMVPGPVTPPVAVLPVK